MLNQEELETHLMTVQLDYRCLWLDEVHINGQIAETLADALDWQPTEDQPLPDASELAQMAARRLTTLERLAETVKHRKPRQPVTRRREFA